MATVFKRGGKANRGGYWYYAFYDQNGQRQVKCSKTTDKATAERIAKRLEAQAALRRDGVIDASDDRYAVENRRPLAEHLDDFRKALVAKGNDLGYIDQAVARARLIVAECSAKQVSDLTASTVQQVIRGLRDQGRGLATCNSYLRSIKGLLVG